MPTFTLPELPEGWVYFATWQDGLFAIAGLLLITLMIIWWRQQTRHWFRIVATLLLCAILLCISSYYIFQVPPHSVSCPAGCAGWRGYPRPVATLETTGASQVAPLDFGLNLLLLWILLMSASVVWRLLGIAFRWSERSRRFKLLFVLILGVLPWALSPRLFNPPQPRPRNEDLRIANNALRAAEFTYTITGVWVQRLALEDIRQVPIEPSAELGTSQTGVSQQVCLRGYTYFYLPWHRYRIELEPSGVTALRLTELSLSDPCWEEDEPEALSPTTSVTSST